LSGGAELVDLGAEEGLLDALGAAELHGGGGLLGEDAREDLAAPGGHGEDDVVGLNFAVGIEDVDQESLGGPAGDARELRADAMPLPAMLVAGLAILGEEGRAAAGVTLEPECGLIVGEDGRPLGWRELRQQGQSA